MIYDPCNGASGSGNGVGSQGSCMPGLICQDFAGMGYQVCTAQCTLGGSGSGSAGDAICGSGTCNMMGTCKPPGPNDCTAPS